MVLMREREKQGKVISARGEGGGTSGWTKQAASSLGPAAAATTAARTDGLVTRWLGGRDRTGPFARFPPGHASCLLRSARHSAAGLPLTRGRQLGGQLDIARNPHPVSRPGRYLQTGCPALTGRRRSLAHLGHAPPTCPLTGAISGRGWVLACYVPPIRCLGPAVCCPPCRRLVGWLAGLADPGSARRVSDTIRSSRLAISALPPTIAPRRV